MSAIRFERVSASYGGRRVLEDVRAEFAQGAVTGVVGPNGAGKTTLLKVALGLKAADFGEVAVLGRPLPQWSRTDLARTIAYLPQGAATHWPLLAREVVALGRLPHRPPFAPLADRDRAAIDAALARCDAARYGTRRMDELSAGERARVLFARALATGAPVLLADEPAAYLDPAHQLALMALLKDEAGRGSAVAVTLHDLSLASRHCDNVLVLNEGTVAAEGPPEMALSDETLARVFRISVDRAADGAVGAIRRL